MSRTTPRGGQDPSRSLRTAHLSSLAVLAALAVAGFVVIELALLQRAGQGTVINVAGRQRMLSQQIAKAAERGDDVELADAVELLKNSHRLLVHGDPELGLSGNNSELVEEMFREIEPHMNGLLASAQGLLAGGDRQTLLREIGTYESTFLPRMHSIVGQYEHEAGASDRTFVLLQMLLFVSTLGMLAIVGYFVMRPTARRLSRQWTALNESELRFQLAVKGSRDAIWDWDLVSDRVFYDPVWVEMFDDERLQLARSPEAWYRLMASGQLDRFNREITEIREGHKETLDIELEMRSPDGRIVWVLCRGAAHLDAWGYATRLVGSLTDVTELREAQLRLRELSECDRLTGLRNREKFKAIVEKAVTAVHDGGGGSFAVMYLDFDGFKAINDALGHSAGDELLQSIATRMSAHLVDCAVCARLGGDEFAVFIPDTIFDEADTTAESLLAVLADAHEVAGRPVVSTASIGLVHADDRYNSAESLLCDADAAMYAAKVSGKNRVTIYDEAMNAAAVERLDIETSLRQSDPEQAFEVLYQPLVDLETGKTDGFEALVRWREHGLGRDIRPDEFIPIAEETGVIVPLGRWVLWEAARSLSEFDTITGQSSLTMHVNVSKRQICQPDFVEMARRFVEEFPTLTGRIILEVTESTLMDSRANVVPRMDELRSLGFPLAMDDFGTGHSSLACLQQFPLDELKVDRSFILNIERSRDFAAVYQSIVSLASNLNLKVVSEGIESLEQLVHMQAIGVQLGQGYFFSKPLSHRQARQYLCDVGISRNAA